MLATGIEVEARPPGKKVKRLSLLSGGERSLTAIAYLFAIFKARPSPFYVLDEVEAALDDTNLQRLLVIFDGAAGEFPAHRRHPPEADDGGRRRPVRHHMRGDGVTSRDQPAPARARARLARRGLDAAPGRVCRDCEPVMEYADPDHRHRRPGGRRGRLAAVPAAAPRARLRPAVCPGPGAEPRRLRAAANGRRGRRHRASRGHGRLARGGAAAAVGRADGAAAGPAGALAEFGGHRAAEPAVPGPARRRDLGRDRRGADHRRRRRGARPADGRRPAHQGQGARRARSGRGPRPAPRRVAHPARRRGPVAAHHAARRACPRWC